METWLKKNLDGYESPIPIGGWKGLHQTRKKKDRKAFYWFLAASIVLFAALGIWNFAGVKNFTAEHADRQDPKPAEITEKLVPVPNTKGSDGDQETVGPPPRSEKDAQEMQLPSVAPMDKPASAGKENEPVKKTYSEIQENPVHPVSSMVVRKVGNRKVIPFSYSLLVKEINLPIKDAIIPRRRNRISFFVEASAYRGHMSFAKEANLATYTPKYSSYIKTYKLQYLEQSLGFGAYYHGLRRWSIGSGLSLSHNTAGGEVNYAYFESGLQLVNLGTQTWSERTIDQSQNLDHQTTLSSWNIHIPLKLRYQLFAEFGPVLEIGANYAYNLKNQGDWVNPETLEPERSTSLVPKHRLSAEIGLGYQWDLKKTRISLNYRFSAWSTKYVPIQGRLGAPLHGIGIQLQMPH